jgi:hypothetical protein
MLDLQHDESAHRILSGTPEGKKVLTASSILYNSIVDIIVDRNIVVKHYFKARKSGGVDPSVPRHIYSLDNIV